MVFVESIAEIHSDIIQTIYYRLIGIIKNSNIFLQNNINCNNINTFIAERFSLFYCGES